jgi:Ni/Fe-hydrogenase 1 B-type cytochrome subunit
VFSSFQFLVPVFGGLQLARLIHHVVMWLLIGFAAHHIWSSILMSLTERNGLIDSSDASASRPGAGSRQRAVR